MKLKERLPRKLVLAMLFLLTVFVEAKQTSYIVWVNCLEHRVNLNGKSQSEWVNEDNFINIVNASFYLIDRNKLIPLSPYASYEGKMGTKTKKRWWTIDISNEGELNLKPPGSSINYQSGFVLSICPVLVYNGIDIDYSRLRKYGSKKFIRRNCPRTLIGKTKDGKVFICVTYGSIQTVRKFVRSNVENVEWLANLDGGTSTFISIDKKHLVKTKREVPSILSFNYYKIDRL